jgi:hypothetical protein
MVVAAVVEVKEVFHPMVEEDYHLFQTNFSWIYVASFSVSETFLKKKIKFFF